MDLTFQIPRQYCSLQHQNLLSPPDTSTTGCRLHFRSAFSFLLELFLHSSPVVYSILTNLCGFFFQIHIYLPFNTIHWVLKARWWRVLPFLSPVPLFVRTLLCDLSMALHTMAHSLINLFQIVIQVIILVCFLLLWFSFCLPSDRWEYEVCSSFLMAGVSSEENMVLLWWAGPCSVRL